MFWLIAETTRGVYLEYWDAQGNCLLSFQTDATIDRLEKLKADLILCRVTLKGATQ